MTQELQECALVALPNPQNQVLVRWLHWGVSSNNQGGAKRQKVRSPQDSDFARLPLTPAVRNSPANPITEIAMEMARAVGWGRGRRWG